jgi:hypothetical protein
MDADFSYSVRYYTYLLARTSTQNAAVRFWSLSYIGEGRSFFSKGRDIRYLVRLCFWEKIKRQYPNSRFRVPFRFNLSLLFALWLLMFVPGKLGHQISCCQSSRGRTLILFFRSFLSPAKRALTSDVQGWARSKKNQRYGSNFWLLCESYTSGN